jgi:hypothetical protein
MSSLGCCGRWSRRPSTSAASPCTATGVVPTRRKRATALQWEGMHHGGDQALGALLGRPRGRDLGRGRLPVDEREGGCPSSSAVRSSSSASSAARSTARRRRSPSASSPSRAALMTRDRSSTASRSGRASAASRVGSIWGHGAYQAPDWSADWLHRECGGPARLWSAEQHAKAFAELNPDSRGRSSAAEATNCARTASTPRAACSSQRRPRARDARERSDHYTALFGGDPSLAKLREDYALHDEPITDAVRLERLTQFFFWTRGPAPPNRPGRELHVHEQLAARAARSATCRRARTSCGR